MADGHRAVTMNLNMVIMGYHEVILGNLHAELPLPCQKVIFLLVTMVTKFSNHWLLNLVTRVTKFRNLHAERW